jgi:predicted house-cleaning NTP pyrophosphatase (Maf/HAM1 superfamily)
MVQHGANAMAKKADGSQRSVRSTVSIPEDQYIQLQRIAEKKRVSLAWVVREAIEQYLIAESPLFHQGR